MSKLLFTATFAVLLGVSAIAFTTQASASAMSYGAPVAKQGAPVVIEDNRIVDRRSRKRKRTGTDDPQPHF